MLGIITYLSSTAFFSPILNLVLLPLVVYKMLTSERLRRHFEDSQLLGLIFIVLSVILAIIFFIIIGPQVENFEKSILGYFPYLLLILVAIFVGSFFEKKDLDVILLCIFIEIVVGCVEFYFGTSSFFVEAKGETAFGSTTLLYFNRVYGLSDNSSTLAFKVLIATIILMSNRFHYAKKIRYIAYSLLLVGFLITFSRTAMVACIVFLIFLYRRNVKLLLTVTLLSFIAIFFGMEAIKRQLFRGQEGVELSGRDFIFSYYTQFILDHPLAGNSGAKLWVYFGDSLYHAHNSFLQLYASNGLVVSVLFLFGYCLVFFKAKKLFLPILVYSLFQYGILWGLVFHDIVVVAIFFNYIDQKRNAFRNAFRSVE